MSFLGMIDDVLPYYAVSQIHVIASLSEGCPTVVLEAMSVGLPSIGFADCPGTNELIVHESNGLLVPPEDRVGGLTDALRRLMGDARLRERLGQQARQDAEQYDPKRIYDQWEQMLYEAAAYKDDPDRLWREQMAVDPEGARHARRMLAKMA